MRKREKWFGQLEVAGKDAHDLVVPEPPDAFTMMRLQAGYTRDLPPRSGFQPGVGASISVSVVPKSLRLVDGSGANSGVSVYVTLRASAHR